jgi:hypothetical protein
VSIYLKLINTLYSSTSYQKKEEARGVTYEGRGDVELDGQKYNSEFKLAHKLLQKSKDAEAGFDVTLIASLTGASKKTLDSQLLVTDKALKASAKFCGDKCSLFDVSNTVKITGKNSAKPCLEKNIKCIEIFGFRCHRAECGKQDYLGH